MANSSDFLKQRSLKEPAKDRKVVEGQIAKDDAIVREDNDLSDALPEPADKLEDVERDDRRSNYPRRN